jgi:hypothetical protein
LADSDRDRVFREGAKWTPGAMSGEPAQLSRTATVPRRVAASLQIAASLMMDGVAMSRQPAPWQSSGDDAIPQALRRTAPPRGRRCRTRPHVGVGLRLGRGRPNTPRSVFL